MGEEREAFVIKCYWVNKLWLPNAGERDVVCPIPALIITRDAAAALHGRPLPRFDRVRGVCSVGARVKPLEVC